MFGPSEVNGMHHRSREFSELLVETEKRFKKLVGLDDEWIVLFVTGSGTLANEIVIRSLRHVGFITKSEGEFSDRLKRHERYCHPDDEYRTAYFDAYVQYETAESLFIPAPVFEQGMRLRFCDMVSSFPYYMPSSTVDVWTTVASKQLGCDPGLSIIVVRKSRFDQFKQEMDLISTMNLMSYVHYQKEKQQTPHTPAIASMQQLALKLYNLNKLGIQTFRDWINRRRDLLETMVPRDAYVGTGPVFTFKKNERLDYLVSKWDMYVGSVGPQVFLHSGTNHQFNQFLTDVKKIYNGLKGN